MRRYSPQFTTGKVISLCIGYCLAEEYALPAQLTLGGLRQVEPPFTVQLGRRWENEHVLQLSHSGRNVCSIADALRPLLRTLRTEIAQCSHHSGTLFNRMAPICDQQPGPNRVTLH